jgi:hypothetical protein
MTMALAPLKKLQVMDRKRSWPAVSCKSSESKEGKEGTKRWTKHRKKKEEKKRIISIVPISAA